MSRRTPGPDLALDRLASFGNPCHPPFRPSHCSSTSPAPRARALRAGVPQAAALVGPPAVATRATSCVGEGDVPADTGADVDGLWRAYLAEPTRPVRDRLVLHYSPLLRAVAQRVGSGLPSYVELADLVQCGFFGLVDAVERFDPARCTRFESYAAQRIRGAILDELRAQDWVPRSVRGRVRELDRAQERLEGRLLRAATDRELAEELDLPVHEVRTHTRQVQVISVEALDEQSGGVSELLAADPEADPMVVLQARETLRLLAVALAQLGERDRTVVRLYYLENRTLAEIGKLLGVTESRVCQLHTRLVGRLRGRMEELAAG